MIPSTEARFKTSPFPGITVHKNKYDATVLRLHYDADPMKSTGQRVHVEQIDMDLPPWALGEFKKMTDPSLYLQEYEVVSSATLGQLIYNMHEPATIEKSFPIPPHWTRYMGLDPHPGIPHAFLWCAVDPWGDRWYYRELWPSRVCYRWNGALLIGEPGKCPDDDPVIHIKEYVEIMQWLESKENPQNVYEGVAFDEQIDKRVIDYAARSFGQGTNDDPDQPNFQQRYELYMGLPETMVSCPVFDDAKKDHDVGFATVNEGLKPRNVVGSDDVKRTRSKIHIFGDRVPELKYQLKNIRKQQLTALQATVKDPSGQQVKVRNHQGDLIRYIEMANPVFIDHKTPHHDTARPPAEGLSY